jgi:hypothetical protein
MSWGAMLPTVIRIERTKRPTTAPPIDTVPPSWRHHPAPSPAKPALLPVSRARTMVRGCATAGVLRMKKAPATTRYATKTRRSLVVIRPSL